MAVTQKIILAIVVSGLFAYQMFTEKIQNKEKLTQTHYLKSDNKPEPEEITQAEDKSKYSRFENELIAVEKKATSVGKTVLFTGRQMALNNKDIVKGGCWDYANEVYNRAGFPYKKRKMIFKSKKNSGRYANKDLIQAGDWLYYINHSYHDVEHSAIFVQWLEGNEALMLSYRGERHQSPARYIPYDLSSVYRIVRAKSDE